jgi:ligand-binding sensor domain-containing protein/signal transduction histidine kinase
LRNHAFCQVLLLTVSVGAAGLAEHLPIRTYTTADGLANNHINCIRQDSRGFLWFCTDEGLSRFDGYQFTSFTTREGLPHPWINDLIETRDGTLWIASDGGVSQFNPRRSSASGAMFITFVPDRNPDARRVNALAEDPSGAIWCATYNGLYRLNRAGGHVRFRWVDIGLPAEVDEGRLINKVAVDRRGTLWLTARTGLYRRFADGRAEHYTTRQGLPDNFTDALLHDHAGRWWVTTRLGGFCSLVAKPHPDRRVVERCYSIADGLPHNDVRSILETSDGNMWVGTLLGLSEFGPVTALGKLLHTYTEANGLSQSQIYKLAEDRDGNLWIGTQTGGVMKMARSGFTSYGEADGFRSGTTNYDVFETTRGELCVLTGTGSGGLIQRFDGQKFVATKLNLPNPAGPANFFLQHGLQARTGEWWLATRHGLVRFPRITHVEDLAHVRPRIYTTGCGLPTNLIDYVYQDALGAVWIVTTDSENAPGLGKLQLRQCLGPGGPLHVYAADQAGVRPSKNGPVTAIGEDTSGELWLGCRDCLVRCRGGRFERLFPAIQGVIDALHLDRHGRLWIAAMPYGLYRVDAPMSARPRIAHYSTADGLSSNEIRCLAEDGWGRIYMGTNRGVDRLDPESGVVEHYTSADGLPSGAVELAYRDHDGALWFVTDEGISRLIPINNPASTPPAVLITALRSMGVPHPVATRGETRVEGLTLAPDRNQLRIDFVGLDYHIGTVLRYQYKLDGADQSWSLPTEQRTVNYASLGPGSYRFLVRAISSSAATGQPAVVAFTVLAPVWRRWWFLTLCGLLISLAAYEVHRARVRQLLALERVRTRIATDLHDDIGSSLSAIAFLSEAVKQQIGETYPGAFVMAGEVAANARSLADALGDVVWSIDPRRDDLYNLITRVRQFASRLLEAKGIAWYFQVPSEPEKVKLAPEERRHLFLILKEAINNIARHAHCTSASLKITAADHRLEIRVEDNGCGFIPLPPAGACKDGSQGNGLNNMRLRAAQLNAQISLESAPNRGTKLKLSMPLR